MSFHQIKALVQIGAWHRRFLSEYFAAFRTKEQVREMGNLGVRKRLVLLLSIAFAVVALDQATKLWAIEVLKGNPEIHYLGGAIRLMYAENTGAWGSMGATWPEPVKLVVMVALPIAVLAWIAFVLVKDTSMAVSEGIAYAFIVSGGIGNIIDRIKDKYVVDFLWMGVGPLTTNVFNVADMAITGAIGLLLWKAWQGHRSSKQNLSQAQAEKG